MSLDHRRPTDRIVGEKEKNISSDLKFMWNFLVERRYSTKSNCFLSLSEQFILIYEEKSSSIILFDHNLETIWTKTLSMNIVDLCYSSSLHNYLLLNEKEIFRFDPIRKDFLPVENYRRIKSNRSMSSICSTRRNEIYLLYRFGEYLDVYPSPTAKRRVWKRKQFCHSFEEDIALIRSTNHENSDEIRFALLIVEFNQIWRVDIYSSRFQRLNEGFRFSHWDRQMSLSSHLFDRLSCFFTVDHQNDLFIDLFGQPTRRDQSFDYQSIQTRSIHLINENKTLLLIRNENSLKLFHKFDDEKEFC